MNKNYTLLYIDDEPINLMLFENIFKKKYTIITAPSGFDGLEKLSMHPEINIVFSDMKMPSMNGVEFVIQAKIKYPDIVYFILTGYDITEEISDVLDKKIINKYFRKPFNVKEIEKAIFDETQ